MYVADERNDIVDGTHFVVDPDIINVVLDGNDENCFIDKLDRPHYKRYMSGPTKLVLRSVKFFPSNSMHHAIDMLPLLQSDVKNGVGVAFLKVDNGGDSLIL